MIFLENSTFLYILIFIIIYNCCSLVFKNKTLSNLLLIAGSFIVLRTICTTESIIAVLLISTLVYFAGKYLNKKKQKKKLSLGVFISVLVVLFVIKNYNITEVKLLSSVGLSYILFRLIHFLIDSSRNKISGYNFLSFLNYIIFFPTFIAGPIDEYNNFNYWIKQKRNTYKVIMFKAGTFKLLLGVVKKFFLVPIIINYSLDFSLFSENLLWQENLFISLLLYSLYILFDFSGYSDIAIGTAYLIGIRTPENFDNPYFSKSLSVFWKKWHMTFSNFLFKYIFKPIVVNLSKYFKKSPRLLITFIGYILTFIICGIWHGNTLNFLYWGFWHGIGLILFKIWNIFIFNKHIKKIKSKIFHRIYSSFAIAVTFLFVTFGWFFFNYQSTDIALITSNLTSKNTENLNISTVIYNKNPCFQIKFQNNSYPFVDIEYKSSENDSICLYNNIAANNENIYYLIPNETSKDLYLIRIRASNGKEKGVWNTKLVYLDEKDISQSKISNFIFGKVTPAIILDKKPDYVND